MGKIAKKVDGSTMKSIVTILLFTTLLLSKMVDGIAVIVEDEIITLYDIQKEQRLSHLPKKEVLDLLIRKKLEAIEIKKRGISVSDDEVYDEIRRLASANGMSIAQFYDAVRESNGLTSSELKAKIKERLLSQKLYQAIAMSKLHEPTQSEIEEYYKLHHDEFEHPTFFDVTIYKAKDQSLLLQKMQNPLFFSDQIQQQSQRIAYEKLPPQLAQILSDTKEGSFTQILPDGQGGYMLFLVTKRGPLQKASIKTVKPQIINRIMSKKQKAIIDDYFEKLKESVNIKIIRE